MFTAISARTGERVDSTTILFDPVYIIIEQEEFFADINQISNAAEIGINEATQIPCTFIKSQERMSKHGNEYAVRPHFRVPNAERLGIITTPESAEHHAAKQFIYNAARTKNIVFTYGEVNKPIKYDKEVKMSALPIVYKRIGVEVREAIVGKIADIIIPFETRDPFFGAGIVIEVQFSKQTELRTQERTNTWLAAGYSVCWLRREDFDEEGWVLFNPRVELIAQAPNIDALVKDELLSVREEIRRAFTNIHYTESNILRTLQEKQKEVAALIAEKDSLPEYGGHCPACWDEHQGARVLITTPAGTFYGCSRYPACNGRK